MLGVNIPVIMTTKFAADSIIDVLNMKDQKVNLTLNYEVSESSTSMFNSDIECQF